MYQRCNYSNPAPKYLINLSVMIRSVIVNTIPITTAPIKLNLAINNGKIKNIGSVGITKKAV